MNLFSRIKKIKVKGSALLSVVIVSGIIGAGLAGVNQYLNTRIIMLERERLNRVATSLNKQSLDLLQKMFSTNNPNLVVNKGDDGSYAVVDVNGVYGEDNSNIRFSNPEDGKYTIKFFHDKALNFNSATTTVTFDTQNSNDLGDLIQWKINVKSDVNSRTGKNYSYDYDVLMNTAIPGQKVRSCVILVWARGGNEDSIYGMAQHDCSPYCYNSATLYIPAIPNETPGPDEENPSYKYNIGGDYGVTDDKVINSYQQAHRFGVDAYNRCGRGISNVDKLISQCGLREKLPAKYTYRGVEYQLLNSPDHNWFNDEDDNWWRNYSGKDRYASKYDKGERAYFNNINPCGGDCLCFVDNLQTSPLVIDLKGKGIRYTGYADPLYFDFGTGSKIATTWLYNTEEAGFLALDVDNDGMIKSGKELFGEFTGKDFKNGFEALKVHDNNNDNVIDDKDPVWNKLQVWNDLNRNAVGEKEELTFLKDTDIKAISLNYEQKREQSDPYGGSASKQSSYAFKEDGTKLKVYDIYFMNALNAEKVAKNK